MSPAPYLDVTTAIQRLQQGDVIGLPTETVYGLAGDALNEQAVRKIFALKKRPFFDPLIVHVHDASDISRVAEVSEKWRPVVDTLTRKFWPGPLTLILPKRTEVSDLVTSGLPTVGVRMPRHPLALEIIRGVGPLAAPSANLFGRTSPTTAEHVRAEFGDDVGVVNGGPCEVGVESAVVGMEDNGQELALKIYRPGAVTATMLKEALEEANLHMPVVSQESPVAPGHLRHHYMPRIPLVLLSLENDDFSEEQALQHLQTYRDELVQKLKLTEWRPTLLRLDPEPVIAARELYARLRELSESGATMIACFLPTSRTDASEGLWDAILNRLEKAATLDWRHSR